MLNRILNNKTFLFLFFICLISPNLFNKLNLIDNHEIYTNIIIYKDYYNFLISHPEIFIKFEDSNFRPLFYIIKGFEFFFFQDNSFFYFLLRTLIMFYCLVIFYKITAIVINSNLLRITLTIFPILNPFTVDIFYRAGPQESFVIIFIANILYFIVKDHFTETTTNKYFIYANLVLPGLIKEPYSIICIYFSLYFLLFSKKFKYKKSLLLVILFQFLILLTILLNYINVGHTYGVENEYSYKKFLNLLVSFPYNLKINSLFIFVQLILILLLYKKRNFLISVLFFVNLFYFSNYFIYQGWSIKRYYLIYVICIYFIFILIFSKESNDNNLKKFSILLFLLLFIFSISFHFINVSKTLIYNINFHNTLKNIENGDILILDEKIKKIDPEKFTSFLIFSKFKYPNSKIILKNKEVFKEAEIDFNLDRPEIKEIKFSNYNLSNVNKNFKCIVFFKNKYNLNCVKNSIILKIL